jgi:sulfatase maturation enzyme AslB (radical SAM superfamily)
MNISLNPWYYCNFRCKFCYLTEGQLSSQKLIKLDKLESRLQEVVAHYGIIDQIDVYGGEVALLPKQYFEDMTVILKRYCKNLNMITNLSAVNQITEDPNYSLSVSYDFSAREKYDLVYKNMTMISSDFSVLMLASPHLITLDPNYMINMFNLIPNLRSVEIKPYSRNQANDLQITDKDFENYVIRWLTAATPKKFQFVNAALIQQVLDGQGHSYSDDHVYITPSGRFAVLEFDINDREYFLEMDSIEEYQQWCEREKQRVSVNEYCRDCEFHGRCLSEHLREVRDISMSCNGYKHLIQWYARQYT